MNTHEILEVLINKIHTVIIATSQDNKPYTCAIDLMLVENNKIYFLTARGKSFYQRLSNNNIALTGLKGEDTMSSIAITINGKVRNIKHEKLIEIFNKNPYMKTIYPNKKARDALEVFEIYEYSGEYFDLSQKPIYRQSFSLNQSIKENGYYINDKCCGCTSCVTLCPQQCINTTNIPFIINQNNCLHCGKCAEVCQYNAIDRRS